MAIINNPKHKWEFENIGGCSRVKLTSGKDIAHLGELDTKMWTVLSCPVQGLEIDEKSLRYMDCDADGKIRVNDVVCISKWITGMLKNPDLLLEGKDVINIDDINTENESGLKLSKAAKQILANLGKAENQISLADTADIAAIFAKTRFNGDGVITVASSDDAALQDIIASATAVTGGTMDRSGQMGVNAAQIEQFYTELKAYSDWCAAEVPAPFADKTDAVIAAYQALDAKMKDFFMRSRLAAFSPDSTTALDVQTSRIEAISAENLAGKGDEIAAYPIARITGKAELDLDAAINPAWAAQFNVIKGVVEAGKKSLTEADWAAIGAQFAAYTAWKGAKAGASVEGLTLDKVNALLKQDQKQALLDLVAQDIALKEEAENIEMVNKFLHVLRDLYRLLKNFITFQDFYNKDKKVGAIFQSGTLIIDQRACRFCMKVSDMGAHNASAATSGMYLVYCDCTTKTSAAKLQIVAAVTVGEVGNLIVGKNAVYYDNAGVEWDAVITKVVDNPISVAQAFWSPYRRMSTAIENLINKSAAEKDAKMMADATAKINAAPTSLPAAPAAGAEGEAAKPAATPPFDIAKFAGIFAAIGMAVGMIGTALSSLAMGIYALKWWQLVLSFLGLMLIISGPAMVLAWMKLRRRNIAPLLNANGWAVNAAAKISIPFGATLTDVAKYPKLKLKDPYAKTGMPAWVKVLITLLVLGGAAAAVWFFELYTYVM